MFCRLVLLLYAYMYTMSHGEIMSAFALFSEQRVGHCIMGSNKRKNPESRCPAGLLGGVAGKLDWFTPRKGAGGHSAHLGLCGYGIRALRSSCPLGIALTQLPHPPQSSQHSIITHAKKTLSSHAIRIKAIQGNGHPQSGGAGSKLHIHLQLLNGGIVY